jgi:integrase
MQCAAYSDGRSTPAMSKRTRRWESRIRPGRKTAAFLFGPKTTLPGTKERVWLTVLLYSGLRRGDAVKLGRQHVRDGVATIRTEKTGVTVTLPILPALDEVLRAGPVGELTFICGERRQPFVKESFGTAFREACRAAGVEKSAHGVRKIGATRAAENGATVAELEALFGWSGGGMAALYTRAADRARLAKGSISKLVRTPSEQSIPAPTGKVRDSSLKDK